MTVTRTTAQPLGLPGGLFSLYDGRGVVGLPANEGSPSCGLVSRGAELTDESSRRQRLVLLALGAAASASKGANRKHRWYLTTASRAS